MKKIIRSSIILGLLLVVLSACAKPSEDKCSDPGDAYSVMKLNTYRPSTHGQDIRYDLYHLIVSSPRVPCDITSKDNSNGEMLIYSYLIVVEPEGVAIFSTRIANDSVPEVNEFIDQKTGEVDVTGLMELKQEEMYIKRSNEMPSDKEMIDELLLAKLDLIVDRTIY